MRSTVVAATIRTATKQTAHREVRSDFSSPCDGFCSSTGIPQADADPVSVAQQLSDPATTMAPRWCPGRSTTSQNVCWISRKMETVRQLTDGTRKSTGRQPRHAEESPESGYSLHLGTEDTGFCCRIHEVSEEIRSKGAAAVGKRMARCEAGQERPRVFSSPNANAPCLSRGSRRSLFRHDGRGAEPAAGPLGSLQAVKTAFSRQVTTAARTAGSSSRRWDVQSRRSGSGGSVGEGTRAVGRRRSGPPRGAGSIRRRSRR